MDMTDNLFYSLEQPDLPEVDLAFALSATSTIPDTTFTKMKEVVQDMINRYGIGKVHYGLVVFGETASTSINFGHTTDQRVLLQSVDSIVRVSGGPDLDKAIQELTKLFDSPASKARPKAKKVAVVIIDKDSVTDENVIKSKARNLAKDGIFVIPVAIGDDTDDGDLTSLTDTPDRVVKTKKTDPTKDVADKVDEQFKKAIKGKAVRNAHSSR